MNLYIYTKHPLTVILFYPILNLVTIIIIYLKGGFPLAALKYSRQRESIKDYLTGTKDHPTADAVYLKVKQEFPNISLGTVYRNLNLLADIGEATKITTPDGGDRFDGKTEPHYHFFCKDCGKVFDLDMDSIDQINEIAGKHFDGVIDSHVTAFYGHCGDCMKKTKDKKEC